MRLIQLSMLMKLLLLIKSTVDTHPFLILTGDIYQQGGPGHDQDKILLTVGQHSLIVHGGWDSTMAIC